MSDKIAVVGAGTMGAGIAQIAAAFGHDVVVIDRAEPALEKGQGTLVASLESLVKKGRLSQLDADLVAGRVRWSTQLEAAEGSRLVVEAIVERMDVKRSLFVDLERVVDRDAVLASNTSSLSIADMGSALQRPERFLGLHFFNPVPVMKLVEVVAGPATSTAIATEMARLMRSWGKRPVAVRDAPGFIVNRVARPFFAEAFLALEDGMEPAQVDAALTGGGGFRMGPLALADMIGHDVNYAAASSVFAGIGAGARFRPQPRQAQLVEQGLLGRKAGRGIYDYGGAASLHADDQPGTSGAEICLSVTGQRFLWLSSLVPLRPSETLPPDTIAVDGVVMGHGDGRPLSLRTDVDVLFDHVHDPVASPVLVATVRDERAGAAAAGLAAMLDKRLVRVPDRPGQIVLRTLAQLANGAADAVLEGVAPAPAIDEAMMFGSNYPQGPLAWAECFGPARVKTALAHIAAATGDAIYAPSAGLDAQ